MTIVSRDMKDIKKQMGFLELKSKYTKFFNSLHGMNSRLETANK